MTRVLPVPAPARIKTGPRNVSTARRCSGFSELNFNIVAQCIEMRPAFQRETQGNDKNSSVSSITLNGLEYSTIHIQPLLGSFVFFCSTRLFRPIRITQ